MITEVILRALLVVVALSVALLTLPLCCYLLTKAKYRALKSRALVDDAILDALDIGVRNTLSRGGKDLYVRASEIAGELLKTHGICLYKESSPIATAEVVRMLSDAVSTKSVTNDCCKEK